MASDIRSLHHVVKKFWIVKAIFVNMKWSIHTDDLVSFGNSILIFFDMRFCTFGCCRYWKEMFFWWVHSLFLLLKKYSSKTKLKIVHTSKCWFLVSRESCDMKLKNSKLFWMTQNYDSCKPIKIQSNAWAELNETAPIPSDQNWCLALWTRQELVFEKELSD